jgi:hypothetical protein
MALLDCVRPDGSLYRTYPDIFVYSRPIAAARGSLSVNLDGPPELIIEVLSEATYQADLHLTRGKGYSYAQAGVAEYLTLDFTGQYVPEGIRARRLTNGIYRPWEPDTKGRWQSARLAFAIGLEDGWGSVFTRAGRRIVREGEAESELARMREELASQHEALLSRDAEIERLRRLLDERKGS